MYPSQYKPIQPEDFIGPAQKLALLLRRLSAQSRERGGEPVKVLLNGSPGVGKSELANFLALSLGCPEKYSRTKYNGTQIKIETVEEIARAVQYRSLHGDYNFLWIDEADKIPSLAQVRFLTLLDDLPHYCAVVCTSNCKIGDFEERFQSRFRVLEVEPPSAVEIQGLLARWLKKPEVIEQIVKYAAGNVRQALLDADLAIEP